MNMSNSEKIFESLDKNNFTIDCKEMRLSPISAISENDQHVGPGSITQTSDGHFWVKMYCRGNITPARVFKSYQNAELGKLLEDEHYYGLEADDLDGNQWTTDPVLPQFLPSMDFNGYVVEAHCRRLSTQNALSFEPAANSIVIVYRGDIPIPCNTPTRTETRVGERLYAKSINLNVASFEAAGFEFEIFKEPYCLRLYVMAASKPIHLGTVARISEALQLILGRTLSWSVVEITQRKTQTTHVRAAKRNEKRSRVGPPIASGIVDGERNVWMLFTKYFQYVLEYEDVSWHPLFRLINSVFKSGEASIEAEGLTLSVSIEGLLKQFFLKKALPNEDFEQKRSEALRIICNSAMDKDFKNRVNGFIGSMKAIQPKDRLYALRASGVIENKLVNSWSELRNPSAHGELVEEKDLQMYLDRCASALVLFYHLIFLTIGYTGNYTDYSSHGYPMKTFNKGIS